MPPVIPLLPSVSSQSESMWATMRGGPGIRPLGALRAPLSSRSIPSLASAVGLLHLCGHKVPITMTTQAPTFTQPLQSVVALEGSAATFEAQISGSPVPEVSWFRDGQVLSTAALPGVQISFSDGRAVLRIPAVTAAHSGRFSVRATNGAGQATSTAELLVTAETAPPSFLQRLQSSTVRQGSQVRLDVRVTGKPLPVVK
ncbi:hypothetical protein LDENG_00158500, partial [Lucifuga dentata]